MKIISNVIHVHTHSIGAEPHCSSIGFEPPLAYYLFQVKFQMKALKHLINSLPRFLDIKNYENDSNQKA